MDWLRRSACNTMNSMVFRKIHTVAGGKPLRLLVIRSSAQLRIVILAQIHQEKGKNAFQCFSVLFWGVLALLDSMHNTGPFGEK